MLVEADLGHLMMSPAGYAQLHSKSEFVRAVWHRPHDAHDPAVESVVADLHDARRQRESPEDVHHGQPGASRVSSIREAIGDDSVGFNITRLDSVRRSSVILLPSASLLPRTTPFFSEMLRIATPRP